MDDRLPTKLWLDAQLKHISQEGGFYTVLQKGCERSGMVLLKLYQPGEGACLFQQQRNLEGELGWMQVFSQKDLEEKIDDYMQKSINRDPDLWGIEIEYGSLENPLEGKMIAL